MKLYVSHISALFFWRTWTGDAHVKDEPLQDSRLVDCCRSTEEDDGRRPSVCLFGSGALHVLVPDESYRVNRRDFTYHVCSFGLPEGSFIMCSEGIHVSSPELCFVQMAQVLSLPGLVMLGMELCGTYRLCQEAPAESHHGRLTTPAKLARFVASCKGLRGQKAAARALRWIFADAASPMETLSYMRLCLPVRMKGYALPGPKVNGEMRLNRRQQELAGLSTSYGDLYWEKQKVDVEYFGGDWHTGRSRMNRDAKRSNALESRGIKEYTLTWEIYQSMQGFDAFAREVARALGIRVRSRAGDMALKSWELKEELAEQEKLTFPPAGEGVAKDEPDNAQESASVFGARGGGRRAESGESPEFWIC